MKLLFLLPSLFLLVSTQAKTIYQVKSDFCDCSELMVSSTGGAFEHYPEYMGKYVPILLPNSVALIHLIEIIFCLLPSKHTHTKQTNHRTQSYP